MRFWFLACALLLGLGSCGDKSAISLSTDLEQPSVMAKNGGLGASLTVGFDLVFRLGPEASGPTTVTPGNFSLQTVAGDSLGNPLRLDSATVGTSSAQPAFPLVVDKGATQTVTVSLSSAALLTEPERAALCAGQVVIVGSIMDSLKGGTDPIRSLSILPNCT